MRSVQDKPSLSRAPKEAEQTRRTGRFGLFAALSEPLFRLLWLGMLPSTLSWQMGQVAVGYVAYEISGAATALGIISASWAIPSIIFGLIGGVVADRFPKRTIILTTQSTVGLVAVMNAVVVLTGTVQIWHLALAASIQGLAFSFNMPARQAFVAELVSRENLMNAIALNNAGMNLMRIIGPATAGALIAIPAIGAGGVFVFMASMYIIVLSTLIRLPKGSPGGSRRAGGLAQLREGVSYVMGHPLLRMLLAMAVIPVLLGMPYVQMMPVFAEDVFNAGSQGLGTLMAVNGAGALVGSLAIASFTNIRRKGLLQLGLGMAFGITLAAFALGQVFSFALVMIAIAGAASSGFSTINSTLIMHTADQAFHGRVMSLYMMTFSIMPLGSVPISWLVDQFGAPATFGFTGLLLALIIGSVGLASPAYRRI